MTEERIVDPNTGGEKGRKTARFDLIPQEAIWALAEAYGRGAEKYEDRNWEKGYDWSLSFGALQRHLWQFWNGEDIDEETGTPHVVSAMWHCAALATFYARNIGTDDRAPGPIELDVPSRDTWGTTQWDWEVKDISDDEVRRGIMSSDPIYGVRRVVTYEDSDPRARFPS